VDGTYSGSDAAPRRRGIDVRRVIAVSAAATLALGITGGISATAAQGSTARPGAVAGSYTPPPINWHKCSDPTLQQFGAQCGFVIVPLDYRHPHGKKIKLAVSRVRHTVPNSQYQGVMLVNPGGPGGSGLIYSILGQFVPNHAGDAYDWIGFDPRGVGSSRPELTCDRFYFHGDRPPYVPRTKHILHRWVARSKRYAADCKNSAHSGLFRHIKTVDNARDMNSIRAALHQKQINYYGFSYGTYLGQVYATMFPHRVRRMVLDSNVDPRKVFYRSNQLQDVAFQRTFDIYLRWIAKNHKYYHLGRTANAVHRTYRATVAMLNRHAARGILGGDEFTDVMQNPAYYVYNWDSVAHAWQKLVNRHQPGDLIEDYTSANPTTPAGDNGYAIYLGTQCTDAWWPHSQARLNRDNWALNKKYPFLTWPNAWFNGPCAYWKFPNRTKVHVTGRDVHVPVLLIDETFDPATPYEGSLYIRHIFPTASLIEGRNGTTHAGSLSGVACTDDSIARYLQTGAVPPRKPHYGSDKVCPPVPKPTPTVLGSASAAQSLAASAAQEKIRAAMAGYASRP
jgi:pimeloyl-ACP methyl ester carboxylesterase